MTPTTKVVSLTFSQTNQYGRQLVWPIRFNGLTMCSMTAMEELAMVHGMVSPEVNAMMAMQFMTGTGAERELELPGGLVDQRFSFILVLHHVFNENHMYAQVIGGYTDPMTDIPVESTKLYFNRSTLHRVAKLVTPDGTDTLVELVSDTLFLPGGQGYRTNRPQDVFDIKVSAEMTSDFQGQGFPVMDMRSTFGREAIKPACAEHDSHKGYIHAVLAAYNEVAASSHEHDQTSAEMYREARVHVPESRLTSDKAMETLVRNTDFVQEGFVSAGELCKTFEFPFENIEWFKPVKEFAHQDKTMFGQDAGVESLIADQVIRLTNAILPKYNLNGVGFVWRSPELVVTSVSSSAGRSSQGEQLVEDLINELRAGLAPLIGWVKGDVLEVAANVSIYSEGTVQVRIGEELPHAIVQPLFCSAALSPQLTNEHSLPERNSADITYVLERLAMSSVTAHFKIQE